jgi:hypothetical protein
LLALQRRSPRLNDYRTDALESLDASLSAAARFAAADLS